MSWCLFSVPSFLLMQMDAAAMWQGYVFFKALSRAKAKKQESVNSGGL